MSIEMVSGYQYPSDWNSGADYGSYNMGCPCQARYAGYAGYGDAAPFDPVMTTPNPADPFDPLDPRNVGLVAPSLPPPTGSQVSAATLIVGGVLAVWLYRAVKRSSRRRAR